MNQTRLDKFTAAIHFSELPPPALEGHGLAPTWQAADMLEVLGPGWGVISDLTWCELLGAVRDLSFARGEEVVTVAIFVSGEGDAAAREWFLLRASANSVPEIPFRRSNLDLGQLAVETEGRLKREILWLFHNLAFHVRAIGTPISVQAVAERLQQRAATEGPPHDLAPSRPRMADREESVPKRKVGELLRVPLLEQPPADLLRQYEVEVRTEGKGLDFVGFEDNEALFEVQAPGTDHFRINVIDRSTLLNTRIEADVEVESS
jgi:hypothetical protein